MIRMSPYTFKAEHWSPLSEVPFKLPLLQNHRGYRELGARENTIQSVMASFEQGYDMVEIDLRLRKDGHAVLFHDPLTEEAQVDVLDDLLEQLPNGKYINLEIKNESKLIFSLEEKLVALLKNHPKKDQLLFSSFNPLSLSWMRGLLPEIPRALLVTQAPEAGNSFLLRELSLLSWVKPHFIHVRWEDLDHYKEIPAERKTVWTLNDEAKAQTLLELERVASIITDTIRPSDLKVD